MKASRHSENTGRLSRHRQELKSLSKDALVELLLQTEGDQSEETLRFQKPEVSRSFNLDLPWEANEYLRLPEVSADDERPMVQVVWRVALVSFDLSHPVLGLEVCGDVVMGRSGVDVRVDLDLAGYGAREHGISRRHALLRPTDEELWLIDLGSTNGTHWNSSPVRAGEPHVLEDRDVIALSSLQFMLRNVERVSCNTSHHHLQFG